MGLADAGADTLIPDHLVATDIRTVVCAVTGTRASVKVPMVVVEQAGTFNALTLTGKDVPLFKFVVTMSHFVAARAVVFAIVWDSVDKLTDWATDQVVLRVPAWCKLARNDRDRVLYFCLCKISTNLLFHSFEGLASSCKEGSCQRACCHRCFHAIIIDLNA